VYPADAVGVPQLTGAQPEDRDQLRSARQRIDAAVPVKPVLHVAVRVDPYVDAPAAKVYMCCWGASEQLPIEQPLTAVQDPDA